jgi:hypothetical protein
MDQIQLLPDHDVPDGLLVGCRHEGRKCRWARAFLRLELADGLRDLALGVGCEARLDRLGAELALATALDASNDVATLGLGDLASALIDGVDALLVLLA